MATHQQQTLDFYASPAAMTPNGGHERLLARDAIDVSCKIWIRIPPGKIRRVLLAVLIAGCCGTTVTQAQAIRRYQVTNLPSLGGTVSRGNSINHQGWAAGYSNLPGNHTRHATLWRNGSIVDLGTLGGPNSGVIWPVKNNKGILVGIAQTATPDPLGERWSCSVFFPEPNNIGYTCSAFIWKNGVMSALPTLGGNHGFASGANDRGQVVGWAENTVRDPTCVAPQVLQFRAVIWGSNGRKIQELLPLPGDTSSAATAINNRGQAVGISGACDQAVGRRTAHHAVLWENNQITDLGNLRSDTWNTPMAINQRGDVVGFAGLPGSDQDNPILHAFLWTTHGGMRDLGTLPGDVTSQANGINDRRQIVGSSCNAAGSCRAFLWENGTMTELRSLAGSGYHDLLINAQDINNLGVITGRAFEPHSGERPSFVARPRKIKSTKRPHRRASQR